MFYYHVKGIMVKVSYVNTPSIEGVAKRVCARTFKKGVLNLLEKEGNWVEYLTNNSSEYILVNNAIYRINLRHHEMETGKLDLRDNLIMPRKDGRLEFNLKFDGQIHDIGTAFNELAEEVVINN